MNAPLINLYSAYLKKHYKDLGPIRKISLHAGSTCPNRDGQKSFGGCTFCNNQSFSMYLHQQKSQSIAEQIEEAIAKEKFRTKNRRARIFQAYFQSYSNTYGPLEILKSNFKEVLKFPMIKSLIIGTRPDCLGEEVLDLLQELNEKIEVFLEVGLESFSDETLKRVNRKHTVDDFYNCIIRCKNRSIPLGTHIMIGFPWEDEDFYLESAKKISALPIQFIKFHQLQVVQGTQLAQEFLSCPFPLLTFEQYSNLLVQMLGHLSPNIVVERLAAHNQDSLLLAPNWNPKGGEFTSHILNLMKQQNISQGKYFKNPLLTKN